MNIEQLLRCKTILELVEKGKYPTLKELNEAVNYMLGKLHELNDSNCTSITDRTTKRDIKDIRSLLRVYIDYDIINKGYYIEDKDYNENECNALLEAANLVFVLQNMDNVKGNISFEPKKAKRGTVHFFEILEAIRKRHKISFNYTHYEKKESTNREVSPLGLKEFKGFWYLVAHDGKAFKTFGLDRISDLQVIKTGKSYYPKDFSLEKHYEHCYGIVRFYDEEPQVIIIKTTPIKASYYKANPLHKSQKIVDDTDKFTIFSIFTYLTYDLQQELLSHGKEEVTVIQPSDGLVIKRYY
jgi:hypothetical protein